MHKFCLFLRAVCHHWWFLMATVVLTAISLVPAITQKTVPQWVYWLGASVSLFFAFFLAWRDEHNLAKGYKSEADQIYSNLILDWFQQQTSDKTPQFFPLKFLSDALNLDLEKVQRGLNILSDGGVVRDDGMLGWVYDAQRSHRLKPGFRRLLLP
jgi:hypothetical protein